MKIGELTATKRDYYVRREFTKKTGLNFDRERDPFQEYTSGVIWQFNWIGRMFTDNRYSNTDATHVLKIFGTDDHPVRRRAVRDAFAWKLFTQLQQQAESYNPRIFEVIAGEFQPFLKPIAE